MPRRSSYAAQLRAELPGYLCPEGFDPVAVWLRESDAPPEVWRALRRAQSGAVVLRDVATRAIAAVDAHEREGATTDAERGTLHATGPIGPWLLEV